MLTVIGLLVIVAFLLTIANAVGKSPLWAAVLILTIIELLRIAPLGR